MLTRGLGRAVLYLQTHDSVPHRGAILHACTHFAGYDAQLEPSRARYNFDLITAGGDREWYLPRLYHAFRTGEDVEDEEQVFDLMGLLAQDGDAVARTLVYDIFARDAPKLDTGGANALVDLDELAGYVFVARQWSRCPLPEDDQWEEDALLNTVEERFGADAVTAALAAAASAGTGEDAGLPAYLAQARERRRLHNKRRRSRPQSSTLDYEAVRAAVNGLPDRRTRSWLRYAGNIMDDALLLRLASDLDAETDMNRLSYLLDCFWQRAFPLPPHRLLALTESDNKDIACAAQDALAHVTHPNVRAFALARIAAGDVWCSVEMLQANPAEEDYMLMAELTQRPLSADEFHFLEIGILRYVEAHPSPNAIPVLLGLYENGPCSYCRISVVKNLLALDGWPKALLREIVWDCAEDTRMLAVPFSFPGGDEPLPTG